MHVRSIVVALASTFNGGAILKTGEAEVDYLNIVEMSFCSESVVGPQVTLLWFDCHGRWKTRPRYAFLWMGRNLIRSQLF